jgi:hypothetical protein
MRTFVARAHEVGGFGFENIRHFDALPAPPLPDLVPLLYNGTDRVSALEVPVVALPLLALFNRASGTLRFETRETLARAFRIGRRTRIVLTGVATDRAIEAWWSFRDRLELIRKLRHLGVIMATAPNYSLFTDVSRYDNLHNMKRIALTWADFIQAGIPCALHVNGRTPRDYERWGEFIEAHPEVDTLAFEFTTGTASSIRGLFHRDRLVELARRIDRPLRLIVRGGRRHMQYLIPAFQNVTVLDPEPYVKAKFRRRARPSMGADVDWIFSPTELGAPLDEMLRHNIDVVSYAAGLRAAWVRADYGHGKPRDPGPLLELCAAERR